MKEAHEKNVLLSKLSKKFN